MLDRERFQVQDQNSKKAVPALEGRIREIRETLRNLPPQRLAEFTGADYSETEPGQGRFQLSMWDSEIIISYPGFAAQSFHGDQLPSLVQALLVYHFETANGVPLSGSWVSFADLPGGRTYAQAFQGYSGEQIVKACGMNLDAFKHAGSKAGGHKVEMADAAYIFNGLPRVPLLMTYWLGEEEFPSTCKILFDSTACNYLPIDACAILGSMLTQRVLRAF